MRTVTNFEAGISKGDGRTDSIQARQPWWLVVCWATGGVALDWYCAFEWFSGRYSLYSAHVLRTMGLFVLLYGTLAFLTVRLVRARWRDIAAVFWIISLMVSGAMILHWTAHR